MFNVTDVRMKSFGIIPISRINIDCFILKTGMKRVYSKYHNYLKMVGGESRAH